MPEPNVSVNKLTKTYKVPKRPPGVSAAIRSLFQRKYTHVEAVRSIDFTIQAGEMVGFIGPNGAGKTTTLKMLSGLLHPTSGEVQVLGYIPWDREPEYLRKISMVLGNKSQMLWDIPPLDTFHVLKEIYHVPPIAFQQTLDELVDLLDMEELLSKPVRNLSLGERMKCELVAGLLHRPEVLYLDEPTLGLDVSMQVRLRRFLARYNQQNEVIIILTSHYMADMVTLCPRVILIHHGRLLYDGKLSGLADQLAPFKLINISLGNGAKKGEELAFPPQAEVLERQNGNIKLRVGRDQVPQVTAHLLDTLPVIDLSVEDPPIEDVIDQIYQEGSL